jgi:hypothetical protein
MVNSYHMPSEPPFPEGRITTYYNCYSMPFNTTFKKHYFFVEN